ncbi:MAG: hypothetical protein WC592_08420 [Candidatus Omnitrophota bacterium]|nr:hypothetical protein [Candidatus Omnitrophota bacterium]
MAISRKARMWTGITLFLILVFNYAAIGMPLIRKSISIKEKYRAILIKQVKSGNMLKNSEDEYMLDIFRREKTGLDRKLLILNCVVITFAVVLASWTLFGLILRKEKRRY